jgi:hypothetical protein
MTVPETERYDICLPPCFVHVQGASGKGLSGRHSFYYALYPVATIVAPTPINDPIVRNEKIALNK